MNRALVLLTTLSCIPAAARAQTRDGAKYETCARQSEDGILQLVETRPTKTRSGRAAFDCHALLVGFNPRRVLYEATIEAVGGEYGLVLAPGQYETFRIAIKLGDYDGRLILIGPGDSMRVLAGGPFVMWNDRFVVMHHHPDPLSIIAVDLVSGKEVVSHDAQSVEPEAAVSPEFFVLAGRLLTSVARAVDGESGRRSAVEVVPERGETKPVLLTKAEVAAMQRIPWVAPRNPAGVRCACEP